MTAIVSAFSANWWPSRVSLTVELARLIGYRRLNYRIWAKVIRVYYIMDPVPLVLNALRIVQLVLVAPIWSCRLNHNILVNVARSCACKVTLAWGLGSRGLAYLAVGGAPTSSILLVSLVRTIQGSSLILWVIELTLASEITLSLRPHLLPMWHLFIPGCFRLLRSLCL